MPVKYKGILIVIFGIYTRCQLCQVNSSVVKIYIIRLNWFDSQPEGLGVAFFATGPGWVL